MKEEGVDEVEQYADHQSDHQSVGQKSGSSQLRSAKSLRKKNILLEKSTFSAQRKIDDMIEVPDNQSQDQAHERHLGQLQAAGFNLG